MWLTSCCNHHRSAKSNAARSKVIEVITLITSIKVIEGF